MKFHTLNLPTVAIGSKLDITACGLIWTFERQALGWYVQGKPVNLLTEVARVGHSIAYRTDQGLKETGPVQSINLWSR